MFMTESVADLVRAKKIARNQLAGLRMRHEPSGTEFICGGSRFSASRVHRRLYLSDRPLLDCKFPTLVFAEDCVLLDLIPEPPSAKPKRFVKSKPGRELTRLWA